MPVSNFRNTVTPYICCKNAAAAIEFYKKAFGATEKMRLAEPDGKVGHAELDINGALIMLADEYPDYHSLSPQTIGGTPVTLTMQVEKVDDVVKQALDAGAKLLRPVEDQFYGERAGQIEDPFGHQWFLMTHIEDVSPEEMQRRAMAAR
jgi:PhnB protein